jgi:glucose-1-phosphate cytidylyltransferase
MTGGRIKRVQKYIGNETFMMTYGDGVCDVNIAELVKFHKQHGKLATLTAVVQEQQKGVLDIGQDNSVQAFREKSVNDGAIINAGYMVNRKCLIPSAVMIPFLSRPRCASWQPKAS